jgi:magnesium chelatase family protein
MGVHSIISWGSKGILIDVECHLSSSLPAMVIVGLGGKAVDESKERIRSAYANTQLPFPKKRITINLAPADIPKDATSLDLAMTAAILISSGQTTRNIPAHHAMIGEVGLDGTVRSVRGIIGKILAGKQAGISVFWVPEANMAQASLIPDIQLISIKNIRTVHAYLNSTSKAFPAELSKPRSISQSSERSTLDSISGQERAKRALVIAAAGGHNIFMYGPPGTGKSMLAKAFSSLLPPLEHEEILEISHLHSLTTYDYEKLITSRPFRAPHHTASHVSIIGGGSQIKPGEISLSHRGVLFMDELPEFSRAVIESLRQPLEDQTVTISRAKQTVQYPAQFILIATANPCPCGYFGSAECICSRQQLVSYQQKISGPILDRIDLRLEVEPVEHDKLLRMPAPGVSIDYRATVAHVRARQYERIGQKRLNAHMTNEEIIRYGNITSDARNFLDSAAKSLRLSARSYVRTAKVARTIADLDDSATINKVHISEALQYRNIPSLA